MSGNPESPGEVWTDGDGLYYIMRVEQRFTNARVAIVLALSGRLAKNGALHEWSVFRNNAWVKLGLWRLA